MEQAFKRTEVSIISPLRYPGSKKRLASYIGEVIKANQLQKIHLVEPFAGGASVSLQLLNDGIVDRVSLIEKDALVASFWQLVFSEVEDDIDWLIEQVESIPVTLEKWIYFKQSPNLSQREKALACLFLNRTSFSGILAPTAGPIGGKKQESAYKIDCRFPRQTLVNRIKKAALLRPKVNVVLNDDWQKGIKALLQTRVEEANWLFYFDPPFFHKAQNLYTHYFTTEDHLQLRDFVTSKLQENWILSYDYCQEVLDLYGQADQAHVELLYSANGTGGMRVAKEAILTNLPKLVDENRLWRTTQEWKAKNAI